MKAEGFFLYHLPPGGRWYADCELQGEDESDWAVPGKIADRAARVALEYVGSQRGEMPMYGMAFPSMEPDEQNWKYLFAIPNDKGTLILSEVELPWLKPL